MPLTDTAIRNCCPPEKTVRLFDGGGLYLEVAPSGGKWWRLKYRFDGKEKRLSLGVYPTVTLKVARERREEAKKLLANKVDPGENRRAVELARAEHTANTFEVIAREWLTKRGSEWSEDYCARLLRGLEKNVFPWIGGRPIAGITAPALLSVLRRIEERGAFETTHRALQNCGQVFRFAIASGRATNDISRDLPDALQPVPENHLAAITKPHEVGQLLRAIDSYRGDFVTRCALRLAPLLFVRPVELREAKWAEFDLENARWDIPQERMKMRRPHVVPLARQAVEILRELHPLTGVGQYLFPSARSNLRPMSNNAILAALRRMGYSKDDMTGHGFRAMARTILDEVLGVHPKFIEHQLAHQVRDSAGRAYNRTTHLPERRKMMQQWADYLDELRGGAKVISLTSQVA
ncbi:MAG: integrase arm-type DNA-binding domain-containing protein [Deltaproteobacteria bacterium]|nr:integrase arm-type DNA-binding domain-containing protein [Deltaproteobacteria bacterium]